MRLPAANLEMKLRPKFLAVSFGVLALGVLFWWLTLQPPRSPRMPKVSIRLVGFQTGEGYSFARFAISNESKVVVKWNVDSRMELHETSAVCVAVGTGGGVLGPHEETIWNCEAPNGRVAWQGLIGVGEEKNLFDQAKERLNTVLPKPLRLPLRKLPTWTILSEAIDASITSRLREN